MSQLVHSIGKIFQPLLDLVGSILAFFYAVIPNYPIDVALLTILIMALLTPLTVKSTKNMAAMQALGPEMKKVQQKYKGAENRAQMNEEMMKLYKEHNVNPASGCLPMLLQMPAFFILYSVIRGITNTVTYPATTKTVGGLKVIIPSHIVAEPRYIAPSTKMYHAIVAAHGQLISFGMNFSDKLLSHHSSLWVAIPFLVLVLASVGLQYLQMARLNARNPQAAQANPQAAMMQKYMPLIFGLIYLNVAAILNVYFIVSSAIRIATQEVLFRKGIVAGPPAPPKAGAPSGGAKPPTKSKGPVADRTEKALPKPKGTNGTAPAKGGGSGVARPPRSGTGSKPPEAGSKPAAEPPAEPATRKPAGTSNGSRGAKKPTSGGRPGGTSSRNSSNGTNAEGARSDGDGDSAPKEHPRSKAKRERKAR